jgi:hypothetical protein
MEEEKGELPPIARPKVEKQGSARGQLGLSADGSLRAPADGENGSGKDNEGILPSINRPGSGRSLGGGLSARDVMREGVDPVAMLSGGEGGGGGTSRSRKGSRKNSARGNASGDIASPGGDTTDALEDGWSNLLTPPSLPPPSPPSSPPPPSSLLPPLSSLIPFPFPCPASKLDRNPLPFRT